jgi:methylated-DNA-protein-cysteine methyltransferase related protein
MARVVRAIPRGAVLSYSRVAVLAGLPGRARLIGKLLRNTDRKLPWWRVVRADRTLAEPVAMQQKRRLVAEGVQVRGTRIASAHVLPIGDTRLLKALALKRRTHRRRLPPPGKAPL